MIIDVAKQSKTLLVANAATKGFTLQNNTTHDIFADSGKDATNTGESFLLEPGDTIDSTVFGFSIARSLTVWSPVAGVAVFLGVD